MHARKLAPRARARRAPIKNPNDRVPSECCSRQKIEGVGAPTIFPSTDYWQAPGAEAVVVCGQCVVAEAVSVAATLRWYMRHAKLSPEVVASV